MTESGGGVSTRAAARRALSRRPTKLLGAILALLAFTAWAPLPASASGPPIAALSFNENAGKTAHDSARNHDATVSGATWTSEGKYGSALQFDGENDYLAIPGSPELDFTTAFTLEAWVRPTSAGTHKPIITKQTPSYYAYRLEAGGEAKGIPEGYISDANWSWEDVEDSKELPLNTWSHLALTYDGTNLRLYINGTLIDTNAAPAAMVGNGELKIGGNNFGNYFAGRIDEVRLYGEALSKAEIEADETTPIASAPEAEPVAALALNENAGNIAHDSAHNHDATLIAYGGLHHGTEWTTEGKYGAAVELDGLSGYLTIPDSNELDFTAGFTLEAWVRPSESKTYAPVIDKQTTAFLSYELFAGGKYTAGIPEGFISDKDWSWEEVAAAKALPINAWSHLAFSYDGEKIRLYVNGEFVAYAIAPPAQIGSGPLTIGADQNGHFFKGKIDEVRLYNEALGEGDIQVDRDTPIQLSPAPTTSKVTSPSEGIVTAKRLKLTSAWSVGGVSGVKFQYREGKTGLFHTIPSSLVTKAGGESISWPVAPAEGGKSTSPLYFDAAHISQKMRQSGGAIQIRAAFYGSGEAAGASVPVEATVNRFLGGPHDATAQVGPGTLDLLTGNLTVSRADASIATSSSALEFSRTFNSRSAGKVTDTGVLGPGWKPGIPVEEAGGSEWKSVRKVTFTESIEGVTYPFEYAILTSLEGYEIAFERLENGTYATPPEAAGFLLRAEGSKFYLADPGGNLTTFENESGGSEYLPVSVSQSGGSTTTTMVYKFAGGQRRLEMAIAPTPNGVAPCTSANALTTTGCRAFTFTYANPSEWGGKEGAGDRLTKITYYAPGFGVGHWELANYKYDANGRLIEEWDPRISPALKEKYTYNSNGEIATLTPPGQEPETLKYGTLDEEEDPGRLLSVERASLVAEHPVAKTTVVYGVPLSGAGAAYDLSPSAVAGWGQADIPRDATAIFPPDQEPTGSPPSSYSRATVYYMDPEGYAVNTATPSGAGTSAPSITTSETDEFGNVIRELSPKNRLRALAIGGEAGVTMSHELETKRRYSTDGTQMEEEWGPLHQVRLESGTLTNARFHKTVKYDEGYTPTCSAGNCSPTPHLPTWERTAALIAGSETEADQRVTETHYNWGLRKPIETIVDPAEGGGEGEGEGPLNIRSVTAYDEGTGQVIEQRQPSNSAGGGAGTTKTTYYTAGPTGGACGHTAQYAGLPCLTQPAAQPGTAGQPEITVTKINAYNQLGEPTEMIQAPGMAALEAGTPVKKTIITYDEAGRQLTKRYQGGGIAVPMAETTYSETLGLPTTQRFICGDGCITTNPEYAATISSSGSGESQLAGPNGVVADGHGHIWVLDSGHNRVKEFTESGEYLAQFGAAGTGNGQFNSPQGIAIDAKGNLWIADSLNQRIQEFNAKGEFLQKFGTKGTTSKGTEFLKPESLGIAPGGMLWVADSYGARVAEFRQTVSSESERFVTNTGGGTIKPLEPKGLAVDRAGNVWVTDNERNIVFEFGSNGAFRRTIGSEGGGTGNGQFKRPAGVAVAPSGDVLVADSNNNRVQEFTAEGAFLHAFGSSGSGAENFSGPAGIAVGPSSAAFIADKGHSVIKKWLLDGAFDAQATTTTYDALGRPVEYEDADGYVSKTTYDQLGRPVMSSDGKGTQTATYDATSGKLTKLEDSAAGTFTAAYDADGNMTERTLPDGLTAKTTFNEVDEPIHLTYTKATNCGTSCTWLDEGLERSINGQILTDSSTLQSEAYTYDAAGRLTNVNDTPTEGNCLTRSYKYDLDSNRESLTTRPGIGSTCSSSGGTEQKYSYDAADRLTGTGVTYDNFGRITSLPAAYAGGGNALTTSYFSNEMVASQTQGSVTNTYELDATGRQRQRLQGGGLEGVEVFHYASGSDSPAWTERGSVWTRNITGIGGELIAIQDGSKGTTLQLASLHGDIVATADPNPATTKLLAKFRFDEFGNPEEGSAGRFGWLGGKSRRTELPSGVVQMGVRSYVPTIGRFISSDPVAGGSASAYDYADADPVNGFDLGGECLNPRYRECRMPPPNPGHHGGHKPRQPKPRLIETHSVNVAGNGITDAGGYIGATFTYTARESVSVSAYLTFRGKTSNIGTAKGSSGTVLVPTVYYSGSVSSGEILEVCVVAVGEHQSERKCYQHAISVTNSSF